MAAYELSVSEASVAVRDKELSPVDLTRSVLERVGEVEDRVDAYVTVTEHLALEAASEAEREIRAGEWRGPLHGIPVAVKDLFNTDGVLTTSSSRVREDFIPDHDAACVERLKGAGAVMVGKARTHEFAYGVMTPPTRNPWGLEHIPGGSSGGSAAAVAAGEALLALGSDTGGSIRMPSALCGTTGLKPTYGRVSRFGLAPLSWSLDHVGPIGRTVLDVALALGVLAGYDRRDPASVDAPVPDFTDGIEGGVAGVRLGLPTNYYFDKILPEVEAAVREAVAELERLGAEVVEVELPYAEFLPAVAFAILMPEASSYHQETLRSSADRYGDDVRAFLELGELVLATDYIRGLRARTVVQSAWKQLFEEEQIQAVIAPTLPVTAPKIGADTITWADGTSDGVLPIFAAASFPANVTGLPALSVPCGADEGGLPIGMQLLGRPFEEGTILRIGHAYESATAWANRMAPL